MPDVHDPATRSRNMAAVRGKDTKPEMLIRRGLHALGFRYRLGGAGLPGRPDLVFPRYRAVIFVNGCFWHGHGCHLFKTPSTRTEFWSTKIERNRNRDEIVRSQLEELGWRSLVIWECALKGRTRLRFDEMIDRASVWLCSEERTGEIAGGT